MTQLSDGAEKASVIKHYQDKFHYLNFIETGTGSCYTLSAARRLCDFGHHFSYEIDHHVYLNAIETTCYWKDTTIIFGDSGLLLERLLRWLQEPALFWLDAHSNEPEDVPPLQQELIEIFYRADWRNTVLIDDARRFANPGWPDLGWIEEQAAEHAYHFDLEDDIIRLYP